MFALPILLLFLLLLLLLLLPFYLAALIVFQAPRPARQRARVRRTRNLDVDGRDF